MDEHPELVKQKQTNQFTDWLKRHFTCGGDVVIEGLDIPEYYQQQLPEVDVSFEVSEEVNNNENVDPELSRNEILNEKPSVIKEKQKKTVRPPMRTTTTPNKRIKMGPNRAAFDLVRVTEKTNEITENYNDRKLQQNQKIHQENIALKREELQLRKKEVQLKEEELNIRKEEITLEKEKLG